MIHLTITQKLVYGWTYVFIKKVNGSVPVSKIDVENDSGPIKKVCRKCWIHVKVYNVFDI